MKRINLILIYDTSGAESGFSMGLKLAKRELHLKSTSGLEMCGLKFSTAMVVDEISIKNFDIDNLTLLRDKIISIPSKENFKLDENKIVNVDYNLIERNIFDNKDFDSRIPRFDICVANNLDEINTIIRPFNNLEISLVKPKGVVMLKSNNISKDDLVGNFIVNKNGIISTSRCGDFKIAITYLENDINLRINLQKMVTGIFDINKIETAFICAKSKESIKIIIKHI
jgi:hypothetical protein